MCCNAQGKIYLAKGEASGLEGRDMGWYDGYGGEVCELYNLYR